MILSTHMRTKKLFLAVLIVLSTPFSFVTPAHALVDDGIWSYVFHLQWKDGVLAKNSDAEFFYDPVPVNQAVSVLSSGDYYAKIVSGKGTTLSTVWFSAPSSVVVAKNKKVLDLSAPFFANADHVTFYTSAHKSLFTVSLAGSSFCNENSQCNAEVGENYSNCAMDCPAPAGVPPAPSSPPAVPTNTPGAPPSTRGEVATPDTATSPEPTGEVVRTLTPVEGKSVVIPITIGLFLVLTALVGMVYIKKLKNARE